MTNSFHYSLSNSAYKNSIFTGLSHFQKDEEFVDLTLAADGYFIKVHKNLIAIASPYLKNILKSMPGQSPVIYLNNVSEKDLTYLLEYIYRGEVTVPVQSVDAFIELSKSLHIVGIQDITLPIPKTLNVPPPPPLTPKSPDVNVTETNGIIAAHLIINNQLEANNYQSNDIYGSETGNNYKYQFNIGHQCSEKTQESNQSDLRKLFDVETFQNSNPYQEKRDRRKHEKPIPENNIPTQLDRTKLNCISDTERSQSIPMLSDNRNSELGAITDNTEFIVLTQNDSTSNTTTALSQNNMPVLEIVPMRKTQATSYQDQFASFSNPIVLNQNGSVPQNQTVSLQNNMPGIEIRQINYINKDSFTDLFPETDVDMTESGMAQDQNYGTDMETIVTGPVETEFISENLSLIPCEKSSIEVGSNLLLVPRSLNAEDTADTISMKDLAHMSQFSITERGSIQLILNRFIYCCHHKSRRRRRWRCIDYRKGKCPASVDTEGDVIIARKGIHAHPYHDEKIYKKHRNGLIFQTIKLAETASIEKSSATIN